MSANADGQQTEGAGGSRATRTRPPHTDHQPTSRQMKTTKDDTTRARAVLEREGLLPPNGTITPQSLAAALTRLTHNVARIPKQALDIINAMATLLSTQEHPSVTNEPNAMLAPAIERLDKIADDIKCATTQILSEAQTNTEVLNGIREETQALQSLREQLNTTVDDLTQRTETATHNTSQAQREILELLSQPRTTTRRLQDEEDTHTPSDPDVHHITPPNHGRTQTVVPFPSPTSYAAAVRAALTPGHEEVLAQSQGRLQQILIERTSAADDLTAQLDEALTEKVLVEKANAAIDLMGDEVPGRPPLDKLFTGAQKLV